MRRPLARCVKAVDRSQWIIRRFQHTIRGLPNGIGAQIEAYGENTRELATAMTNMGRLYQSSGRNKEARKWLQRALDQSIKTTGADSFDTAYSMRYLARLETAEENYASAEPLFERTIATFIAAVGEQHPHVASSKVSYAHMLLNMGRAEDALVQAQSGVDICTASLPPTHSLAYNARLQVGLAHLMRGDLNSAGETLQAVFDEVSVNLPGNWVYPATVKAMIDYHERAKEP